MTPRTILLIEGHGDTREVYGEILRRAGYRVLAAKDGGEGVRLAREHLPDLVVTDLALPVVDGWHVTGLLKQHAPTAHIPVIAITANTQNFYRGRAEALGCSAFLEKPCSPALLLETIERLL
jgi:two-component system cell cycle response regulator DivK